MTKKEIRRNRRLAKAAERRASGFHINPRTGKSTTGRELRDILERRERQTRRITKKKDQRRAFRKLSPWQRQAKSFAGLTKQGLPEDRAERLRVLRERVKASASAGLA